MRRYRGGVASVLGFPDTVNEKAARVVAGGVAVIALVTLITGWHWLLVPLALRRELHYLAARGIG